MEKLKVVGWTNYNSNCQNIIVTNENQQEVIMAVIEEITSNKYVFFGDQHQSGDLNCVPVFNNGKCLRCSMRTIAMFLSIAYNNDPNKYMDYYMKEASNIKENFPTNIVDESIFVYDEGHDAVLPLIIQPDYQLIFESIQLDMSLTTLDKAVIANYKYILVNRKDYGL